MRKNEYVKLFQEKLKEEGLELKQKEVDVVLDKFKELVVDIFKSGEDTTIGGFLKIGRKEIEACEKTHTLPEKKGETYYIPASTKPTVKLTSSFVKEHMILK
ncbi:TPA: HU family DNA-binding protein [Clostridioides difficile]|uniref:HU family DNA-binding protein n=1 Tax=Clostridioides difficile TaxID=1496 RepID=UPI000D1E8938|nr:HU family DNA-binding protein [Clostridioides difficile]MBY1346383.1 HU family DNA-binding protein [Clostridioides difficile]MBY2783455.1 HU family DNA-binding protein [Clostridioides difficile]HBE8132753.1 HU family DNA-binding protein [Clostridioides difficile]HBF2708985.1 HU family DNA-binding protein [Clostridioides difficile]HBF3295068.1 HU family DNA-binding protein [Clostridioides difficile]